MTIVPKFRVYWDSCVWIAWNNKIREPENHLKCAEVLKEVETGRIEIVVTPLVLAEFSPSRNSAADVTFQEFLRRKSFIFLSVSRVLGENARELTRTYRGLPGFDALHLACAIHAKAELFHTFDNHLLRLADSVTNIKICQPDLMAIYNEGPLFNESE